jgi:hypothetical protein
VKRAGAVERGRVIESRGKKLFLHTQQTKAVGHLLFSVSRSLCTRRIPEEPRLESSWGLFITPRRHASVT